MTSLNFFFMPSPHFCNTLNFCHHSRQIGVEKRTKKAAKRCLFLIPHWRCIWLALTSEQECFCTVVDEPLVLFSSAFFLFFPLFNVEVPPVFFVVKGKNDIVAFGEV